MNKLFEKIKAPLLCGALILIAATTSVSFAQTDTLHILSYNVLYLGDTPPCQDPHNVMEGYIETVIAYANPDIVGFVKMEATGSAGSSPTGFQDSVLQYILNAAYPGRYAACPYTNTSGADNISMLFYNQQKLGYSNMLCSNPNITDFDTWKLYYKSTGLATTHDSIFLYVTLNHDNSGSGSSDATTRGQQIEGEMDQIETHFTTLPNMINMGDFNTQNSSETCYQTLIAPANLNYRYYDPPFYPDATYSYPANWSNDPDFYAPDLTVSTRYNGPNSCSSDEGGGHSWFDHIFLSANVINNVDHISYVPHSFKVIGNDGNRVGIAVNASPVNTSAPADVINAIYQISEHYPLTLDLLVNTSTTSVSGIQEQEEKVTVINPVTDQLLMQFTNDLVGRPINITCTDVLGRIQMSSTFTAASGIMQLPCALIPGIYCLKLSSGNSLIANVMISKK